MPGDASDRVPAFGLFWCVVVCGLAVVATFPPDDSSPVETTLAGLPRLVLYAIAGVVLAATGTKAALAEVARWRDGATRDAGSWTATAWLGGWLLAAGAVAILNARRLSDDIAAPYGPTLWLVSMAFVVAAVVPVRRPRLPRRPQLRRPSPFEAAVGGLLAFAALLRFVDLGGVPPNVQADEGDRAATALDVLDGVAPASWFDSGWFYVNMVYFRALAAVFDVFGVGVVQGRLLNAAAGLVVVGAVAWIGFRHFGRRVGFVATALAAASPFALQFSRTIAESGVGAALFAVSLAGFFEGGRSGRPWPFAVAGLAGGLSLYTYASARGWPLAAAAAMTVLLAFARDRRAPLVRGALVASVAAAVAVAPYAVHLSQHRDEATLRYEQTSVLEPQNRSRLTYVDEATPVPEVLVLQLERSLGLFDRYQDGSDFLPTGAPVLPGLVAALTLLGAFFALARARHDPRHALLSIWFWLGLSGMVLTVETPAGQRAAALLVTLPLLAALALVELANRVPSFVALLARGFDPGSAPAAPSPQRSRRIADGVVAVAVAAVVGWQVWAYFVDFRARTEPWAATTTEGREVARLGRDGPVYSLERDFNHVSAGWVRFLARDARTGPLAYPGRDLPFLQSDEEVPQPDPRRALPLPSEADTMTLQLYTPTQRAYIGYLRSLYPGGRVETTGDELRIAFRVAPGTAGRRHGVRVLRDGRVIATMPTFGTLPPGTRVPAVLVWRAGIRVARTGIHRFALTAPAGATLEIDGRTIAETTARRTAEGAVALPAGVHLVAINAPVSSRDDVVDLRWSKRLGSATQQAALHAFRRSQTSPAMTEPRGLTVEVVAAGAPPPGIPRVQRWLDSGVAADFGTIGDRLPLRGTMTWRGNLVVDRAGIYRMAFPSDGRVRVALAGRPIQLDRARTDGIALGRGAHPIRITLPLGEPRPSYIRWSWIPPRGSSGRSGGWSVVPPTVLRPYEPVRLVSGAPQS